MAPPRRPPVAPQNEAFERAARLHKAGQLQPAEAAYRQLLRFQPGHADALSNLGALLRTTGRFDEAVKTLERAVQARPGHAAAWSNLSNLYRAIGRVKESLDAGYRAIELSPTDAVALANMGNALFHADRFDQAKEILQRALAADPRHATAWINMGNVHQRQCRIDEAIACYEQALAIDPTHTVAYSNKLFCLHFSTRFTPLEIADAHRAWADRHEQPLATRRLPARPIDADQPVLKVGMVSSDLREHPVADFLRPLLRHWPAERLALHFYSASSTADQTTQWFKQHAAGWRDVAGLTDEALARQIRADGIDVLFDLTGHTAKHRLLAFAYRPAPVQATWLGYFDTTGMSSMDFLLADPVCVKPGEEARYSEEVICLPNDFVCYEPPADAPEVGPLPALASGAVTFGSQNQIVKVTDDVIRLWARVVLGVPGSRLLLGGKAFNDESTRQVFLNKFAAEGLEAHRLMLRPGTSKGKVLSTYNEIDIALDPFPCAGGTTTCEALWMGVPVVSLYGERFGGRHSASHLRAVGLQRMVAYDEQGYLALTRHLAGDLPELARLRAGLREQMRQSALCDGAAFARDFLEAVETMWRRKAPTFSESCNGVAL